MRLAIVNNWSILLGFIITLLAFSGMLLAVFFPEAIAIDLTPSRSISKLEVPLKHLGSSSIEPEEILGSKVDSRSVVVEDGDNQQDAPAQASRSLLPQTGAVQQSYGTVASNKDTEDPLAYQPPPAVPVRVVIPSIDLNAPVIPAPVDFETIAGKEFLQWFVPDEYAIGWHTTSAMLGETGNTVLNGHHNAHGEVFVSLVDVNEGDIIWVESDRTRYIYQITNKMILPEKYEQLDVRMNNAQWILPTVDERLTLITCWPYETNTHRLIVVARPLSKESIDLIFE
jgi:LPXTG-site transpeptidase (sortase) family protein